MQVSKLCKTKPHLLKFHQGVEELLYMLPVFLVSLVAGNDAPFRQHPIFLFSMATHPLSNGHTNSILTNQSADGKSNAPNDFVIKGYFGINGIANYLFGFRVFVTSRDRFSKFANGVLDE